ncbi:MAG: hypothetical protein ACQCN5_07880 [Candidatus Bathyarchaeia archaeon]
MNKVFLVGLSVVILALAFLAITFVYVVLPNWSLNVGPYFLIGSVFSTLNTALAFILLTTYFMTFRKTKAEFNLVLIIVALTLLSYSIVANPLVASFLGYAGAGLGPFLMLPDICIFVTLVALLYLKIKY